PAVGLVVSTGAAGVGLAGAADSGRAAVARANSTMIVSRGALPLWWRKTASLRVRCTWRGLVWMLKGAGGAVVNKAVGAMGAQRWSMARERATTWISTTSTQAIPAASTQAVS